MKIAVLISGEYRMLDVCRPTMKFLDDLNTDVYVSTWDCTTYDFPMLNRSFDEKITTDKILKDLGRDAVIQIDSVGILSALSDKCGVYMMYRWQRGFELIKKSKIHYDYVIIVRPDLYIGWYDQLKDLHRFDNALGVPWTRKADGFLNDVFLISSYSKMLNLFDNLQISEWIACTDTENWHQWWYQQALQLVGDIVEYQDMYITVCRPTAKSSMTFDQLREIEIDWQDLKMLRSLEVWPESAYSNWPSAQIQHAKDKWKSGYFDKYKFHGR